MSDYNRDQTEAILLVRGHLRALGPGATVRLRESIQPYLEFRAAVAAFQETHLAALCRDRCFSKQISACCGREGILTFFADTVINLLLSTPEQVDSLLEAIARDRGGEDCVYLHPAGCLWRLKPIVCEMFLCDFVKRTALEADAALAGAWEGFRQAETRFTRPTMPVLFDDLERLFIEAGLESPLMYFHRSPGLLRLKAKHGVGRCGRAGAGAP